MLEVGLNPYGLTYWLGLQGAGSPRANPKGVGLEGFIKLATELGARVIELHNPWLTAMSDDELAALRERLAGLNLRPVIGSGLAHDPDMTAVRPAAALGAKTIRLALTRVLCGERNALGEDWPKLVTSVREGLKRYAAAAAEHDIWLAIEDHQDFTSRELMALCDEAGPNVGICYDIANPFAVGEAPIDFTHRIASKVRHIHLKDYNVQFTDEGIRLVRSAIGDGAVPIKRDRRHPCQAPRAPDRLARACRAGGAPHPALSAGMVERLRAVDRRRACRLPCGGPPPPPAGRRRLAHAVGDQGRRSGANRLRAQPNSQKRGEHARTRNYVGRFSDGR